MGDKSGIEWTDATWNPVTGCTKVSEGCDHCYMFREYPRLKRFGSKGYDKEPDVVQLMPERLETPLRWRKPRRVFVNSMSDLFHSRIGFDYIEKVFDVMRRADAHVFQVLTKRPGRAASWFMMKDGAMEWPDNVWIGTSVESQRYAPRIDTLARIPAKVRFVSAEPFLEAVDLEDRMEFIDWLIVGGESGPGARPMELDWARLLRDQAMDRDVPFFLKQLGGAGDKRAGQKALLDGRLWTEEPEW